MIPTRYRLQISSCRAGGQPGPVIDHQEADFLRPVDAMSWANRRRLEYPSDRVLVELFAVLGDDEMLEVAVWVPDESHPVGSSR